jgi:inosine-uridine nucleoside N-ribohydrolase
MNESDIVKEVARRTSLPEDTAAAVLHAMRDLVDEGVVDATALSTALPPPDAKPDDPRVVDRLIARAKQHPLGIQFLVSGFLATVAITLGAHAFTVEAARRRLQKEQQPKEENPK